MATLGPESVILNVPLTVLSLVGSISAVLSNIAAVIVCTKTMSGWPSNCILQSHWHGARVIEPKHLTSVAIQNHMRPSGSPGNFMIGAAFNPDLP